MKRTKARLIQLTGSSQSPLGVSFSPLIGLPQLFQSPSSPALRPALPGLLNPPCGHAVRVKCLYRALNALRDVLVGLEWLGSRKHETLRLASHAAAENSLSHFTLALGVISP